MDKKEATSQIHPKFHSPKDVTYPKSLAQLVQTFQFLGTALGGVNPEYPRDANKTLLLPMIINIAYIMGVAMLVFLLFLEEETSPLRKSAEPTHQTKPILSFLVNSVIYLFGLTNLFCFVYYSFLRGRKLIAHLSDMSILTQDQDRSLARALTRQMIMFMLIINVFGTLVNIYFGSPKKDKFEFEQNQFWRFLLRQLGMRILYNAGLVMPVVHNIIFIYVIKIYSRQIKHLRHLYTSISIPQLVKLKRDLVTLQEHFNGTIELLQLAIIFSIMSNTSIIIGSLCMLLIINTLINIKFIGLICLVVIYSILTLSIIIFYGDRVHLEYKKLLNYIRYRIIAWNSLNLLYLLRLSSSCNQKFNFSLYKVFTLNQTTLITLSTFILNYIVLLIQTDHSKAFSGGGKAINGTLVGAANVTESIAGNITLGSAANITGTITY